MNKYTKCILFLFLFNLILGQFGKNIVQYDKINWNFIQTEHFDIYYYEPGELQINYVAHHAEEAYNKISELIGWDLNNRSAIIVYNSHNDFQQTNVIDSYMEEGIGGVTELMKNRMVIPFDGSNKDFIHVLYHELVHVFINDGIYGGSLRNLINSVYIPLWMNEGLAEYLAGTWDTKSDMWMRDLAINSDQMPPINMLNGYLAYRGGQSVWKFITEKWGEESIAEIFYSIQSSKDINRGLKNAIGLDIEDLTKQWHKYLKKEYWPDVANRDDIQDISRQITDHEKLYNSYNIGPSPSPDGTKIAMYSNKNGELGIYIISMIDGRFLKRIIRGARTSEHEQLHILNPGISWSPNGEKIIFAAKSGDADALFIYDVKNDKQIKKIKFNDSNIFLEGIRKPVWNPKNNLIAFVGNNGVSSDIYLYNLDLDSLINITNDWYSDLEVSWHPNGKDMLIISDRQDNLELNKQIDILNFKDHNINNFDIYKLSYNEEYYLTRLTYDESHEMYAKYSPSGDYIAYISDKSGVNNIYISEDDCNTSHPITNIITGITQLNWNSNNQIIFTGFYKSGYDIFALSNIDRLYYSKKTIPVANWKNKKEMNLLRKSNFNKRSLKQYTNFVFNEDNLQKSDNEINFDSAMLKNDQGYYYSNKYKTRFTLDYANASYIFDSQEGAKGMGIFLFSDILGDHRIRFGTELQIDLKESDYFLFYQYLKNRLNHNVAFYHQAYRLNDIDLIEPGLSNGFLDLTSEYITQTLNRNFGLDYQLSYPFSKYSRLEGGVNYDYFIRQIIKTDYWGDETSMNYESENLVKPHMRYVFDNTRWFYTHPVSGSRLYLNYEIAPSLKQNDYKFEMMTFDIRTYFEFSYKNKISFATRFYGGKSTGESNRRFLLGGIPWLLSSDDNLINQDYENDMNRTQDFYFMNNYVFPIRGYQIAAKHGRNTLLMNYELRLPFLMYYFPTIQFLGQIFGVFFVDMGVAWDEKFPKYNDESSWEINNSNCYQTDGSGNYLTDINGEYIYENDCGAGWLMSYGFGPRFILFGMPWKLDYAWQYDPYQGKKSDKNWYITIGFDF